MKEAIISSSGKCIVINDSSKYRRVTTFVITLLTIFDLIIFDNNRLEQVIKTLTDHNIVREIAK